MAESLYNDFDDNDILFEAMLKQAVIESHMKELAELPSDEELRKMYTFSERHNKRMKKLFAADKRKETRIVVVKWCRLAVATVCITTTVLFGTLLFSSEVRAAVNNTIISWLEMFTRFQSPPLDEEFVEREWTVSYLPTGFELYDSFELGRMVLCEYMNAEGVTIDLTYVPIDATSYVDNTDVEYSIVIEDGIDYHVFVADSDLEYEENSIVWNMQGYRFTIAGIYDIDELLKIALSVIEDEQ